MTHSAELPICRGPNWAVAGALCVALLLASCGKQPESAGSSPPGRSSPHAGSAGPPWFSDVSKTAHVDFQHQLADGKLDNIMESDGAGGTLLDFDNDGWIDIYLVNSGPAPVLSDAPASTPRWPNRLFRNRGDGTFEDVTSRAGVEGHGFGTTAAAADYDNDGYTDLLVVNFGGLILYHNRGDGTFEDVTEKAGLSSKQPGISATFLDADGDGWLDLCVANYLRFDPSIKPPPGTKAPYPGPLSYEPEFNLLYHNRGDGTFEDISQAAGIRIPGHRAMSVTAFDYNLDGYDDLYISNDGTANLLLANDGKGRFKDVSLQSGAALNQFGEAGGSMGATVGDCNADGFPDMFVTRFGHASLYINSRGGFFEDRIQQCGVLEVSARYTGWGGAFLDFDNDGDLDLFIVNGHAHFLEPMPCLLLQNDGNGSFREVSGVAGPFFKSALNGRGALSGDLNNDGKVDLVITTLGGPAVVLKNEFTNPGHWLLVKLEGSRSNRDGFGAQVKVVAGTHTLTSEARCPTSYVSQHDSRLHFGLGTSTVADRIEIRWPHGGLQVLTNVPADRVFPIRELGESRWPARK